MEREIKFRAWDKKYNEMTSFEKMMSCRRFAISQELDSGQFIVLPHYENVVLMQYTGLKDKNGKEIFEKDIVRIMTPANQIQKKSIISEIGFCDSAFCAYWRVTELWEGYSVAPSSVYYLNCLISSDQIEVIGNIYENPELLKSL